MFSTLRLGELSMGKARVTLSTLPCDWLLRGAGANKESDLSRQIYNILCDILAYYGCVRLMCFCVETCRPEVVLALAQRPWRSGPPLALMSCSRWAMGVVCALA